jgi:tol-pal system protein YbgF
MKRLLASLPGLVLVLPLLILPVKAQSDLGELLLRIDRLEGENRRLNGQVEQMGHQVRRLEDQLKRFQADVDFRFREGGGKGMPAPAAQPQTGGGVVPAVPAVPAAPVAAPAAGRRSDAFDPAANPAAPGAPRPIGQAPASPAPQPLTPGTVPEPAKAVLPAAGTAKGDFDIARAILDRGDFEAAEMAFRDFLKKYPKDRLKPEALFNLGESFYRRNRYREAAEQFLAVTTDHPKASRAPEAMLKLGMSLRGLGATAEACGTYGEVSKKYPAASASVKQAVEREKKRAQCAA